MAYDNFLVDKRVVERNIKKGLVDPEALKQQIEGLPDRESNCVHVSLEGGASTQAAQVADDVSDTDTDLADDADDADDDLPEDDDDDDDDDDEEDEPGEPGEPGDEESTNGTPRPEGGFEG